MDQGMTPLGVPDWRERNRTNNGVNTRQLNNLLNKISFMNESVNKAESLEQELEWLEGL